MPMVGVQLREPEIRLVDELRSSTGETRGDIVTRLVIERLNDILKKK